jgi:LacI family repressor for deo operon, udp, cdd, tsx, nupC, and nupG
LIGLGHQRIAMLSGPAQGIATRMGRIGGYEAALAANNIQPRGEYKIEVPMDIESGSHAMRQLLELPDPPTAVFVTNTFLAVGALAAIQKSGLRFRETFRF